jgi:ribosomal protein S18 acetylase RimI-like enzyme
MNDTSEHAAVTARPVAECTAEEVVAALGRGFEGYLVPIRFTPQAYERRFRAENLDPYASRVYVRDGAPVGAMLIARRGWTSRVAAMGFAPEVRGQGLGRRFLGEAIAEAAERGDRAMLLEVFAQNEPAVGLYTSLGFEARRPLLGFRRDAGPAMAGERPSEALREIDPLDFGRLVTREGEADLPWALQAETLAAATLPARAFSLAGHAYALLADPAAEKIAITALLVPRPLRRQGWGTRLVRALDAAFPGRPWAVSPVVPMGLADGFFSALGWGGWDIHQIEMRKNLQDGDNSDHPASV